MNTQFLMLIALSILVSGCAVRPIGENNQVIGTRNAKACDAHYPKSTCEALQLADGYRRGYLRRADLHGTTREIGGLLTIGGATTALYYGLSSREKFRDRVLRTSSVSAGLLAAGQWAIPPLEEQIYIEGAQAMTCAALLAYPALIPQGAVDGTLDTELKALDGAIFAIKPVIPTVLAADRVEAEALVAEAETALNQGHVMAINAARQGEQLYAHIHLLDAEVRQLLASNAPNFQSLNALLAQLPAAAKTAGSDYLKPAPSGVKISDASGSGEDSGKALREAKPRPESMASARQLLADKVDALREALRPIRFRLARAATATGSVDAVTRCKPKAASRFSIAPDAAEMDVNKTLTIVITDKGGFPSANVVGDAAAAVKLAPIELGTRADEFKLTLTGVTVTPDKFPTLSIRSTSGLEGRSIKLNVKEIVAATPPATDVAPKTTGSASKVKSASLARTEFEQTLLQNDHEGTWVLAIQCLLQKDFPPSTFDPDCVLGPNTRAAILNRTGNEIIRANLLDEARAALPDADVVRCTMPKSERCNLKPSSAP